MAVTLVGFALFPVPPAHAAPLTDTVTGTGVAVSAIEETAFHGQTASFTDSNSSAPASSFTVTIDWGDGNITGGSVSGPNGGPFKVSGTNTYVDEGAFRVTTTITSSTGSGTTTSSADVADAGSAGISPTSITATEGTQFSGLVATYESSFQSDRSFDTTVTIDWGDGTTPTAGAIVFTGISGGFSHYNLTGHHTYADEGTFTVQVTASEDVVNGIGITTHDTATVAEADGGTVTPVTFSATEGTAFTGTVLTFTGSAANSGADFATPTIDWGDGTTTNGTIASPSPGTFAVNGTHTYAEEGTYTTAVTHRTTRPARPSSARRARPTSPTRP
jgi:hypothetical protein